MKKYKFDIFKDYKNNINLEDNYTYFVINGVLCKKLNDKSFRHLLNGNIYKV